VLDRTITLAARLRNRYARLSKHPGYRILLGTFSLGFIAAIVWFIWKQISGGYAAVAAAGLRLEPQRLIISWFCTTAATALGAWEWVLLARALGGQLDLAQGMSIHLTSNLVKYVPGFIWSYAGKGYLAVRRGVPASIATLSIAAEFAIVYICGALLLLLSLPFSDIITLPVGGRTALQVVSISVAGLLIIGLAPLAQRFAFRTKTAHALFEPFLSARWSRIAFVMIAVLLTWCLLAIGFSVLYGQSSNGGWSHLLRHSIALVAALLLGKIAFFAPTGVGVREAVLVALLATDGNAADVLILAVVFRMQMILGEVVCAIIALAAVRIQSSADPLRDA
jgi:uncharacterized membrane protein YbhN (UPF0104 family)